MTTDTQFEESVRTMLHRRAADVDVNGDAAMPDVFVTANATAHLNRRQVISIAAAVALLGGTAAVVESVRPRDTRAVHVTPAAPVVPSPPPTSTRQPIASTRRDTPMATALAYLHEVAALPMTWPMGAVVDHGDGRATVQYVLQDGAASVDVARDPTTAMWFVTGATNDRAPLARAELGAGLLAIDIGPGGADRGGTRHVKVTALADDGTALATTFTDGELTARSTVSFALPAGTVAHVVRADVMDDHDGNPATPDVDIAHAALLVGVAPWVATLPAGYDAATAAPVFTADGSADGVATAYLRSRFPDYPAPGVHADPARVAGNRALVTWTTGGGTDGTLAGGALVLRRDARWGVVVAATNGVDLAGVADDDAGVHGTIRSDSQNSLFADVLDIDGQPVPGSPQPSGHPGATTRFGTAGGPSDGTLSLRIPPTSAPVILRVHLVGGTLLSVSELRLERHPG